MPLVPDCLKERGERSSSLRDEIEAPTAIGGSVQLRTSSRVVERDMHDFRGGRPATRAKEAVLTAADYGQQLRRLKEKPLWRASSRCGCQRSSYIPPTTAKQREPVRLT